MGGIVAGYGVSLIKRSGLRSLAAAAVMAMLLLLPSPVQAGQALVAVASNFMATARELATEFENRSDHRLTLSFASTGKLYTQIANGAPFEVLLAADTWRPAKAEAAGLAVAGSRFTYASGKIVLCSSNPQLVDNAGAILYSPQRFRKIAIANPLTAPYGAAAVQAMQAMGVYESLKSQLVRGENIAQAYQFMVTGNAELGFVASSQLGDHPSLSVWPVPETLYTPIKQDAVLLSRGADNRAARDFMAFLQSDVAKAVIARYGYGVTLSNQ